MNNMEERGLGAVTHILGLFTGFLGPLIVYLVKTDEGFARDQAREALNFQITVMIASIISAILIVVLIGIALIIIVGILDLIFCIIAAVRANNGEFYRYPINISFIKHPGVSF